MNADRLASRKFILAAFAVLAATVLLPFGVITPEIWSSFMTWVIGMYFTGNVAERFVIVSNPNLTLTTTKELMKD
jgi:hypothetical protein